ncbi:unnamed protein product [Closterium sp. NIES-54]
MEWVETRAAAATGCKGADVAEDMASVVLDTVQRRTTTPTTNKEVPVVVAVRNLDVGASRGEQGDASAKIGAELHPLDYWVLDTGAAWTMTPRKELLDDVRAAPINKVCSASGHVLKVASAGQAAFKGADGKPVVLLDVLLDLDLKANLISLRKLAKAGVSTSTDGARTYKGQLGNRVLWDLHESKDVYRSMWQLPALAWHGQIWGDRLGNGTPTLGACGNALIEAAREGWSSQGSKKPLELVHMDLVGPLPVQGHKGEWYFLTIVDDWSRLMWAYPLKQKDHAASTIKEDWLPFVEKQAECVVKRIRTDRGGEFLGAEMTACLKKQGIQRELTTAYSPQSNGVAEQANRTILETARALLIESGVGNSMWPHAVWHATVAGNRVLTKVGNESWVPLERWLGRKSPVNMLRVFGCMAVAHVPKKYRSKLGASAIWCVAMAGNTSAGAGESSAQDRSGSQDSGVSAPRGAQTNQGSLIKEVLKNFTVEKFNGEGYDDWAWKMQLNFRQIGLLKLIIGEEPRPSDPPLHEDWDERASAGYYLMSQSLELNQRHHVMHLLPEVDCGPNAWTVLKELHAPTSVVAMLMLERQLSALRLSEGEPVQPVLDKMRDLYAKLATAGITYPEQTKCLKMLSLLPESWLQFTSGLSLPQNQSLWTLEWVRTKILEEDFSRRQLRGGDDGSSGYGMQGSRRGRGRGFGGAGRGAKKDDDSNDQQGGTGWGRGAKSGRGGKSGAGGKMKGSCWYCEKEGHPWFLCYKKPDGWTPQNRHQDGGARRN